MEENLDAYFNGLVKQLKKDKLDMDAKVNTTFPSKKLLRMEKINPTISE